MFVNQQQFRNFTNPDSLPPLPEYGDLQARIRAAHPGLKSDSISVKAAQKNTDRERQEKTEGERCEELFHVDSVLLSAAGADKKAHLSFGQMPDDSTGQL